MVNSKHKTENCYTSSREICHFKTDPVEPWKNHFDSLSHHGWWWFSLKTRHFGHPSSSSSSSPSSASTEIYWYLMLNPTISSLKILCLMLQGKTKIQSIPLFHHWKYLLVISYIAIENGHFFGWFSIAASRSFKPAGLPQAGCTLSLRHPRLKRRPWGPWGPRPCGTTRRKRSKAQRTAATWSRPLLPRKVVVLLSGKDT